MLGLWRREYNYVSYGKMVICSRCRKEVNDIRPQIEGVGVCQDYKDLGLTDEAMELWEKIYKKRQKMYALSIITISDNKRPI